MKEIETTTMLPAQSTGNRTTFMQNMFLKEIFLLMDLLEQRDK